MNDFQVGEIVYWVSSYGFGRPPYVGCGIVDDSYAEILNGNTAQRDVGEGYT